MDQPRIVQQTLGVNGTVVLGPGIAMKLFKSSFVPGPGTVLADLVANEVAFTGYVKYTTVAGPLTGVDANGHFFAFWTELATFLQTAVTASDVAGGWWLDDGASTPTTLLMVGQFDTPVPFDAAGNTLVVKPNYGADFVSGQDAEVIFGP